MKRLVALFLVAGLIVASVVPAYACDWMDYYSPWRIKCPVKKCKNYSVRRGEEYRFYYYIEEKTINGVLHFRETIAWSQAYMDISAHAKVREGRHYCPWKVSD